MKRKSHFIVDFMPIAYAIVEKSDGRIRLAYKEKDKSRFKDAEVKHFLKFDEERIGKDIEFYSINSIVHTVGHALPDFFILLLKIKYECPQSYSIGVKMIKEIGDNLFKDEILKNWDNLLQ